MSEQTPDPIGDPEGYALWCESQPECPQCGGTGVTVLDDDSERECLRCDGCGFLTPEVEEDWL